MSSIRLLHLSAVGPNLSPASIAFHSSLTVVWGSSETGKSYIAELLDFMLGRRTPPKEIPEAVGYTTGLLGLTTDDLGTITLARPLLGGQFSVFRRDLREYTQDDAEYHLASQHNETNFENLSNLLLDQLGLAGKRLRKNQKNATVPLSFRNIAPFCIVDETTIQAERSPILSGQYTTKTSERAAFKLLLTGDDDSHLVAAPSDEDRAQRAGSSAVVERLIFDLERSMADMPSLEDLENQQQVLAETIVSETTTANHLAGRRDRLMLRRSEILRRERAVAESTRERSELLSRFELLREQYETDLARLEMVGEVGSLLGYFTPGVCIFCGAEVEHQHPGLHTSAEATDIAESVDAERQRTTALLTDLLSTMDGLRGDRDSDSQLEAELSGLRGVVEVDLRELDMELSPNSDTLRELFRAQSILEKRLSLYDQLERLVALREDYGETIGPDSTERVQSSPSPTTLSSFCSVVRQVLEAWQVPDLGYIQYDREADDLLVGDRVRSTRGKGVRSLLHASFNVGLLQYCLANSLPHPGFVVLDSPLITYSEPYGAPTAEESANEAVSGYVSDAFFRSLCAQDIGQALVLENTPPPRDLYELAYVTRFTANIEEGRPGFFPIASPYQVDQTQQAAN